MGDLLIRSGRVLDPSGSLDDIKDILIKDGKIQRVEDHIEGSFEEEIEAEGLLVCPGFVDVHVHFRDPGFTYKEDIHTGALCAAAGGYTSVVMMANTKPSMDSKENIEEVLKRAGKEKINIYMVANVTKGMAGKELVDMEEMKAAGAAGFSDDGLPIMDKELMKQALIKAKELGAVISLHEEDPAYIEKSGINAGPVAEKLNYKGADRKAEIEMVKRDIDLVRETGSAIDIQHISALQSVELVREAKKEGLKVYAEATPHHFTLTEADVLKYGSNCKMNPPVREEKDRLAIIEGLKDGTIDMIATDHAPHSKEEKDRALADAPSGIIGLESAFSLALRELVEKGKMPILTLIERMSLAPSRIYGLKGGSLKEGFAADIVIIDPKEEWLYDKSLSKASNSPFLGQKLKGRVKYTIVKGQIIYRNI
ncbi:MAG: dihydroorotase [Lachnospiraceae bacterium]|nr:dihydroorotase [Lachnospiraceae bacterium]